MVLQTAIRPTEIANKSRVPEESKNIKRNHLLLAHDEPLVIREVLHQHSLTIKAWPG